MDYNLQKVKKVLGIQTFYLLLGFMLVHNCIAQKVVTPAVLLDSFSFVQYAGGVIVFEAKVGGELKRPLRFILDTGSGGASIDSATAAELGLLVVPTDTIVNGIAGARKVSYVFNQTLTVGRLNTANIHFYVNDYSIISSVFGDKIDGIIGYSFLSRYIFEINFDNNSILVYSNGAYTYPIVGTLLVPQQDKLLTLSLEVKEKTKHKANYYFDTGAGLNLLLTEDYITDNNILLSKRKPLITQHQGLGGKKRMRLTVIRKLKVGPYSFSHVPTNLYVDESKIFYNANVMGLLGNDIIRRFNTTLNYAANQIHLKPNNNYKDEFDYAYTGLSMYSYDNKIMIDDIIEKSPADKALLQNGDELIGVGTNFTGNITQYEKLLQKAKEKIKLIIKRNEQLMIIELKPLTIR